MSNKHLNPGAEGPNHSENASEDAALASVKDALGAYGECCYNLEAWTNRKAAALELLEKAQAELAKARGAK